MEQLVDRLKTEFQNEDVRYAYVDGIANALIAAQIKALQEDRGLTQEGLAGLMGTKQSGISRFQRMDYSSWKVETLRKFARAFGVRFTMEFKEFGSLPSDIADFGKERLTPREFDADPVFQVPNKLGNLDDLGLLGSGAEKQALPEPAQIPSDKNVYDELLNRGRRPSQPRVVQSGAEKSANVGIR